MRSTLALLSAVALLAGCEDPAPPPAEMVVEAGQIQIVYPDEYLEESDGTTLLRKLATRSRGSNRVEFQHVVLTEALEGGPSDLRQSGRVRLRAQGPDRPHHRGSDTSHRARQLLLRSPRFALRLQGDRSTARGRCSLLSAGRVTERSPTSGTGISGTWLAPSLGGVKGTSVTEVTEEPCSSCVARGSGQPFRTLTVPIVSPLLVDSRMRREGSSGG